MAKVGKAEPAAKMSIGRAVLYINDSFEEPQPITETAIRCNLARKGDLFPSLERDESGRMVLDRIKLDAIFAERERVRNL